MHIKDIIEVKDTKLINGSIDIDYFSINTNDINGKTMFIPLKGKTDGHDYILNGVNAGIAGFFVEKNHDDIIEKALEINKELVIIETKDNLKALQDLARLTRNRITVPLIALTGSYGKTSQKEMIYSVLKQSFTVLTSLGNFNNDIGMPLTLINYNNEQVVLLELGSNHMGEIAFLRDIAKPTITLITSIGTSHIGNFKNIKNTLKEKTSIIKGCDYFFLNMDDNLLKYKKFKNNNVIKYSVEEVTNIIRDKKISYTINVKEKNYTITINSDIEYLINYSLVALKIGLLLGMNIEDITKGIGSFKCAPSRMEKISVDKYFILNDCYNASYETMINGLEYFNKQDYQNKIAILGDILELGKMNNKIHMNIAKEIYKKNYEFEEIHLVGPTMKKVFDYLCKKGFNVFYYKNVDDMDKTIMNNKSVYLKASNGIGLSKLLK